MPRPHPQKEGKGHRLVHFKPFLVFADSTIQDPGLHQSDYRHVILSCDLQTNVRTRIYLYMIGVCTKLTRSLACSAVSGDEPGAGRRDYLFLDRSLL